MEDNDTARTTARGFLNDISEEEVETCNATLSSNLDDKPNGTGIIEKGVGEC